MLSDLSLIDFWIKIGDSSFNWHASSYCCTITWEYYSSHCELQAKWLQIYLIVIKRIASLSQCKLRGNKFTSLKKTTP